MNVRVQSQKILGMSSRRQGRVLSIGKGARLSFHVMKFALFSENWS